MLSKLKILIFNRANGLCEYCKSPANISSQPFVLEHILPQSKGGLTSETNLALSCQGCNNHKYNKTEGIDAVTNEVNLLFNPRIHIWTEHFSWSDSTLEIIGISSIGRVSIDILKSNRQELKNLRELLLFAGKHPPFI